MKVPYFDIRSHFLLWMILSKVFSMFINADSQSAMLITEARRTGGKYASITRCFLFRFSTKKKRAAGDGNPSILAYFSKKAQPLPDAGE